MSPLKCHTVHEAIWERAAGAGPVPLSPALAEHLGACPHCQAESRAVMDLLATARELPDPAPPEDLWDGFDAELERRLDGRVRPLAAAWRSWGRRAASMAAVLAVGFALGVAATRVAGPSPAERAALDREAFLASLAQDARLEAYLALVEERLGAARERGALPEGLVAGPGVPSAAAADRAAFRAAGEERLRTLLLAALASELEAESRGFGYIDRRIASIAGEHFLYFVR